MAKQNLMIKSDYFVLTEFTRSATAARLNIDNTPSEEVVANLQHGVDMVLDPLRRLYGKPIIITSGYRSPILNEKIGGVKNSWHCKGCAADIRVLNKEDAKIKFNILRKLPSVDTCLFEHSESSSWLHVQWCKDKEPRHHFNFNYKA